MMENKFGTQWKLRFYALVVGLLIVSNMTTFMFTTRVLVGK